MPGYVVVEVTIHDPELYESYKKLTPGSIEAFGGKFVVRGGQTETLEGEWHPERFVILEFPSVEVAKAWWESDAYTEARSIRERAATTKLMIVEGL